MSPECPATLPAGVQEEGPGTGWRPALGTGSLVGATSSIGTSTRPWSLSSQGAPREAQPQGEQLNHPARWRSVLNPAQSWPALVSSLPALSLEDGPWEGLIQRCGSKHLGCKVTWSSGVSVPHGREQEEGATRECKGSRQLGLGAGVLMLNLPYGPSTNAVTSDTQRESRGRPELPDLLP